jgi:dolichyl-phosphate-mannose-protein mannosyltransferase
MNPSALYSSEIPSRQSVLDRTRRNLVCSSLAIFVVSLAFMLWGIAFYRAPYFDETWYVPTARELLQSGGMLHQEHPPLGKLLITGSIWIFGDNPLGWRAMSAIFGSLTLVGMFFWSFALFRDVAQSLWVTAITFFDQILYVQARIATLDIFLMTFCTFALVFFTLSVKERQASRSFGFAILMGISLGLAIACKWSGLFLLFGIMAVKLLLGLLRVWRVRFEDPREADFFSGDVWAAITPPVAALVLGLIPLLVYFVSYVPQIIHEGTLYEFVNSHRRMYEIMSGDPGTHPYSSLWFQWPAMTRPVWYLFHLDGNAWTVENRVQAVVALVNPAVLVAGEIAITIAAYRWISAREMNSMIVTVGFFSQYLPWAANPKGLEFSYYFFPSLLCLGPALGLVLLRPGGDGRNWPAMAMLVVAGLCFVFFMPILSAHVGVTPQGFGSRIWFQSWR